MRPCDMKAITIQQPWISLILDGHKTDELRSWRTNHRGILLLHAAKRADPKLLGEFGYHDAPRGAILGHATIIGCRPHHEEGYAWALVTPQRFARPIPWRGMLFLFDVPSSADEQLSGLAALDQDAPLFMP